MLNLESPRGLSATGPGPAILLGQLAFLAVAVAANLLQPEATRFVTTPSLPLTVAGTLWVAAGIVLWTLTMRRFLRGFPRGELITDGPYRWCRHPLYASLILFVVPGIGLITHTWTVLLAALAGALWARVLIPDEERAMERAFGQAWRDYCARTSRLIPRPRPSGGRFGPHRPSSSIASR